MPTKASTPRQLKKPRHGKRIKRHLKVTRQPLPSAWRLLWQSIKHLFRHWRVFIGIVLIYLILTMLLVKGFGSQTNIAQLKAVVESSVHGHVKPITTGLTLFSVMIGSVGNATSDVAGAYQTILIIVISLALIWALRQTHSDQPDKATLRDAFYKSEYPLIPFLLMVLVTGLQLVPLLVAGTLYNILFGGGLLVNWYEKLGWGLGLLLLAAWSVYMVSSSIFALYIVTIPDMRPFQALRSARELVRYRRWAVMRKVVFLPAILLLAAATIIIPLIYVWTTGVEWVFLVLDMMALAIIHSYMYSLYRSLL